MVKRQVMFTFPPELTREPVIFNLGLRFRLIPNIRRADISEDKGWVVLELEGEQRDIEAAVAWLVDKGIRVDPVSGDVVEG